MTRKSSTSWRRPPAAAAPLHNNPWETTDVDALVSISRHHKLNVSTCGPPRRNPGSPVVLFFSGGGTPCAAYVRFRRLLSSHVRVLFHDRAGYGYSDLGRGDSSAATGSEVVLTAQQAARELRDLLQILRVGPPYILVGHSYGCICARAFLALLSREQQHRRRVAEEEDDDGDEDEGEDGDGDGLGSVVAGMVLVEAATELMYDLFEPSIPPPVFFDITRGVDFGAVTRTRERSGLTEHEWEHVAAMIRRTAAATEYEDCRVSARRLLREQQFANEALGDAPLAVVRAYFSQEFRLMFEAGEEMGNGTEEDSLECRAFLGKLRLHDDELRASQLRLSSVNKYITALDHGHSVLITGPEVGVEAVRWVLERWSDMQP
ncbi:hypothetical protein DHEL01_v212715 [Diaporthe helianthi]|uniref:AB hydrolase-1 domain-containing protein n=1 Tax=Diaporthe helianthi TaxID=158607 RepID=A0A2P5HF65_DIAHE|nr:hypothetical protein DHEL01_v212715 [Diaporthe helianthi]